ncbi:hypothetical protein ACFQS7_13745 [Dankookia sp. GCM10030260]|uniref:hypothetical protein n=1 Tax=Dankookia sp. GCM10030260 TaxID=3273390 RepID=UPI003624041C
MPIPQPAAAPLLPGRDDVRSGVLAAILHVRPSLAAQPLEDRHRFDGMGTSSAQLAPILFGIESCGTRLDGIETAGGLTTDLHRRLVERGRAA